MKQKKIWFYAVSFLIIFCLFAPSLYAQEQGQGEEPGQQQEMDAEKMKKIKDAIEKKRKEIDEKRHLKVDHKLTELEDEYKKGAEDAAKRFTAGEVLKDKDGKIIMTLKGAENKGGEEAAKEFARKRVLTVKEGNKITIRITLKPEISAELFDKTILQAYGCEEIHGSGNRLYTDAPLNIIRKIADEVEDIEFIDLPGKIRPQSYQSEGVSLTGASTYQAAGYTASNVKVAVIDTGFKGLSNAISNGDLPGSVTKVDCTGAAYSKLHSVV